jgi:hypothetical protein
MTRCCVCSIGLLASVAVWATVVTPRATLGADEQGDVQGSYINTCRPWELPQWL